MVNANTRSNYKRTARILTVACGFLFFAFSFTYLYVFQKDVLEALHFSLSGGKTVYSPLGGALILTVALLLLHWGVNVLLGLKGVIHALSYFPSFLLLGVLTDVSYSVYQEGISDKWIWLFPLLIVLYVLVVFALRRMFRWQLDIEVDGGVMVFSNLAILLALAFMKLGIGNTDIHFHHELAVETALRKQHYAEARQIGEKVTDPSRSLTALRAFAMSKEGTLGEYLFRTPQLYGAEGLLLDVADEKTLRITVDSLYTYLGEHPKRGERALPFFQRICNDETGNHTTLEYYLSALLLEKQLGRFVTDFHALYEETDTLPRYYREALFLHGKLHPASNQGITDEALEQQWQAYEALKQELSGAEGEKNFMRRKFGDTYWWYYQY